MRADKGVDTTSKEHRIGPYPVDELTSRDELFGNGMFAPTYAGPVPADFDGPPLEGAITGPHYRVGAVVEYPAIRYLHNTGSIFGKIGRGISRGFSQATHAVARGVSQATHAATGLVNSIDRAYVKVTPHWLRQAVGVVALGGGGKLAYDTASAVAKGERVDRALMSGVNNQVDAFKGAAPYIQLGVSFIPGVGTGVSAALGAGVALAEGKPISDAVIASVKGALPGGPIAAQAFDVAAHAAVDLASGKKLDAVALDATRRALPSDAARIAFDTGLALAQGKKRQDAAAPRS
jgi:hypothetical protein